MSLSDYCEGSGKYLMLGSWAPTNETELSQYQNELAGGGAVM